MTEIFKLCSAANRQKHFDLTLQRVENGININFLYINNYLIKYLFYTLPTASYYSTLIYNLTSYFIK